MQSVEVATCSSPKVFMDPSEGANTTQHSHTLLFVSALCALVNPDY